MYYSYFKNNGIEYASALRSVRNGDKVTKAEQIYLGRVVDKGRHIFRSKKRGLFVYDIDTGEFLDPPSDFEEPPIRRKNAKAKPRFRTLSFGDAWLLDHLLHSSGLMDCLEACRSTSESSPTLDTMSALLQFYLLSSFVPCLPEQWWELTYAHLLYPTAQLSSEGVDEVLTELGSEEAWRAFNACYLASTGSVDDAVLFDCTAEGYRLTYVVERHTGRPLYFQATAGKAVDVSCVTQAVTDLQKAGIHARFAILDAGESHDADVLADAGVSFLMRVDSGLERYRDTIERHLETLECEENAVHYYHWLLHIKAIPLGIGAQGDKLVFLYLCKEETAGYGDTMVPGADESTVDFADELDSMGVSVLISTEEIEREELLPLYHTRDQTDEVFEIDRRVTRLLPVRVDTMTKLRGHLLLSFMANAILKMMSERLRETSLDADSALVILHDLHAIVYDDELVILEPRGRMREGYEAFDLTLPEAIRRTDMTEIL